MDLFDYGWDAAGPLFRVGNEVPRVIALLGRPAVVDVDVGVPKVLQPEFNELVGCVQSILLRGGIALSDVLWSCVSSRLS